VNVSGEAVEGYNIVFGGGFGADAAIGKEVFKGISFSEVPQLLARVLDVYQKFRESGESFAAFTRRHEIKQLQEMFSS
jgi:ferredoxin-nitrite reductase